MKAKGSPGALQSMSIACVTALTAVNFTHPIETVKTRLQVGSFNFSTMMKEEGFFSLWKGIQAGWMREASYTSIKLGGYGPVRDFLIRTQGEPESGAGKFLLKFASGSITGSTGSVVGNPFDVMKTMMMTSKDSTGAAAGGIVSLTRRMLQDQGVGGFFRGVQANIMRACVLNGTKMSCYDAIKGVVKDKTGWNRKDPRCQFFSAVGAGFFMTCTVSPFDNIRTRLMNQPTDAKVSSTHAE